MTESPRILTVPIEGVHFLKEKMLFTNTISDLSRLNPFGFVYAAVGANQGRGEFRSYRPKPDEPLYRAPQIACGRLSAVNNEPVACPHPQIGCNFCSIMACEQVETGNDAT